AETRIPEAVIINGQQTQGVTVVVNGRVQQYSCSDPTPYITNNQSSSGWACYDQNSGTWLLQALPPQSTAGYTAPNSYTYYGSSYPDSYYSYYPNSYPYYSYSYPYSYPYYPYSYYPYFYGPAFGFGFGFGNGHFHGGEFHGSHGFATHGG